jgi:S-formylglutathione hydrolase FrmB
MSRGRVETFHLPSEALRGNALGDPADRDVPVILPPGYDDAPARRYPVVVVLAGYTGRGVMSLNRSGWGEGLDQRMDRLVASGACGPMILVLPDCFTRLGGSQYLDSTATGRYETHVVAEIVPEVDRRFRTLAEPAHRGVLGKSSGGYGAMVLGMRHPDVFGAIACHSADMAFEHCYLPDFFSVVRAAARHGSLDAFLADFERSPKKRHDQIQALNILAMASAYSPNPQKPAPFAFDLPFDLETGEVLADVWARWLAWDPVRMVEAHAEALRRMRLVFLDCGKKDEFRLDVGARILARRLRALGVACEHEEFDDGHMDVHYRYDVSLPKIAKAIS